MEPGAYNTSVVLQILESFPDLKGDLRMLRQGELVSIEYPSPMQQLTLLISPVDNYIIVGFSAGNNLFGWHEHMDMQGAGTTGEMVAAGVRWIEDIIYDRRVIAHSSVLGYLLPEKDETREGLEQYKQPDERFEYKFWSQL